MLTRTQMVWFGVLTVAWLGAVAEVQAATRTWTGAGADGNWFTVGNWNPSDACPQAGEDVVISNAAATVVLSNDTAVLSSLTITNTAKLVFTNYAPGVSIILYATNMAVQNGAKIQHSANSAVNTNALGQWVPDSRIYIVCTNLTVDVGGQINADAAGYMGATSNTALRGIGGTVTRGFGPGGGGGNGIGGDGRGGGGGYGGRGGNDGVQPQYQGITYGSTNAPDQPGSSGGLDLDHAGSSGAGGGLIRLAVNGALIDNGSITAIGGACSINEVGAGSGGGIYITCGSIAGTGSILANGGDFGAAWGGDGGGGRIAVQCIDSYNWRGSIRAAPGLLTSGSPQSYVASNGRGSLFITSGGYLQRPLGGQSYYLYGLTNLNCDSLVVSNSAIDYMEPTLAVTITNDISSLSATQTFVGPVSALAVRTITLVGSTLDWGQGLTFTNRIDMTTSVIKARYNLTLPPNYDLNIPTNCQVWVGRQGDTNYMNFQVNGNLNIYSNAALYVFSGISNSLSPYGGLMSVTGNVTILGAGTLLPYSHPTNGGSLYLTMSNLTVYPNSSISAAAAGYVGNRAGLSGYGPGGGGFVSDRGYGAGYGGTGGFQAGYNAQQAGSNYGSATAPCQCGSAGGGNSGTLGLNPGGGLIRIDTPGTVTVNGFLIADGQATGGGQRGGGSGGGIYVTCNSFTGAGSLSANGGADTQGGYSWSGTGGGGRIAVISRQNTVVAGWTGSVQAGAGATNGANNGSSFLGTTGTVYWPLGPYVTNAPANPIAFTIATLNGGLVANGTGTAAVAVYWGPTDGGTVESAWANTNQFPGTFADGTALSTNVTGLVEGGWYYYRFTASNAVSKMWAPATAAFRTIALSAVVSNMPATQITTTSATLNGYLSSTGTSATTVSVLWGTTDGGASPGGWDHTNTFAVATQLGVVATNVPVAPLTTYFYRYSANNAAGAYWESSAQVFMSGEVTVQATATNAAERGPIPGAFTLYRPPSLTNLALTVNYAISGTASNLVDYFLSPPDNPIIMAPGVSNVTITVMPIWDDIIEGNETVGLTVLPGAYAIGSASNAAMTILDDVVSAGQNVATNAGNWSDKNTWSQGRIPIAGDDVTVKVNVTLTNATRQLNSFTITNATLTFTDTTNLQTCLNALDVHIRNAGILTHAANSAFTTNSVGVWPIDARVYVVCNTLTVDSGGSINAIGKGFAGGANGGIGYGPGGGTNNANAGTGGGGGGHGGSGVGAIGVFGGTYDSVTQPVWPGSGGSGRQSGEVGGAGGGLIIVQATGLVTENGTITADAANHTGSYAGAGSGGGIYIQCQTFTGTNGVVSANGGNSVWNQAPGGGGGRIAVAYDPVSQSTLNLTAPPKVLFEANQGGCDPSSANAAKLPARPGTLYFPDAGFFPSTNLQGGQIVIPGFTAWSPASLTISSGIVVMAGGFQLNVSNNLTIGGRCGAIELSNSVLNVGGSLMISNNISLLADSICYGGPAAALVVTNDLVLNLGSLIVYSTPTNAATMRVGGNLVLTNTSALTLSSAMTNSTTPFGAVVDIGRDMIVGPNAWVYPQSHSTNGGSPYFRMANLNIAQGGGLNADFAGFAGGGVTQNGYGDTNGCGKSHNGVGDNNGNGAGYGGNGGGDPGYFGTTYGSAKAPTSPGSGGSGRGVTVGLGGAGGGLVRIQAVNQVTVNGLISANGQTAYYTGAGSGGGIFVQCWKFSGTSGILSANGGVTTGGGGGGGGGRIGVVSAANYYTGATNVLGGIGASYNGSTGTVVFTTIMGSTFTIQ